MTTDASGRTEAGTGAEWGDDRKVVTMDEWDRSDDTYSLSNRDLEILDNDINGAKTRLRYEFTSTGEVRFRSRQFAGIVALPDGPLIQIAPKAAGDNFLHLLRYSQGSTAATAEPRALVQQGRTFIDAITALFVTELEQVIDRGLLKEYEQTSSAKSHVRGRINLQRQLQRQGPTPTKFECTYSELTVDTLANQAVLYAGNILTQMTQDEALLEALSWELARLGRSVSERAVSVVELDRLDLNRLNDYYEDLLRITRLVLESVYIETLQAGTRDSSSILLNMNTIFEQVVERVLSEVVDSRPNLRVRAQAKTTGLLSGTPTVRMYPDFVIERSSHDTAIVGDAKWKTGRVSNSDIYQLTSYSLAHDAPGVLLYPAQEEEIDTEYDVRDGRQLSIYELDTDAKVGSFDEFQSQLRESAERAIEAMLRSP